MKINGIPTLAEIPSATETFLALVQEMQRAGADNRIVDLRKNTGGNSGMRDILIYFLFGRKALEILPKIE